MKSGTASDYYKAIRLAIVRPAEELTLLDLCCGEMSMTCQMKFKSSIHTDIKDYPNRPNGFPFVQGDVFEVLHGIMNKQFDVCLCSDGIEHFIKQDGYALLREMERVSKVQIIFTPIGEMWIDRRSDNPNGHKSGWTPDEFREMGWLVREFPSWHKEWGFGAFFAWKGAA